MAQEEAIKLFGSKQIRIVWDSEKEKYFFSIIDVIQVLTDSVDATAYWRKLKQRLKAEGNETVTNCNVLKLTATDSKKMRKRDSICSRKDAFFLYKNLQTLA